MNIALIGYGKMGKAIEAIALERGHTISQRLHSSDEWDGQTLAGSDVAIEFTKPGAAVDNILTCFGANIPVVTGTTGWYEDFGLVEDTCRNEGGSLFHATNFSLGVNIFFELNRQLAQLMDRFPNYNVKMQETHHTEKLDAPSGTAITLAKCIMSKTDRKTDWINGRTDADHVIGIVSHRVPEVPGTHIVHWESEIDSIELKHEAKSRKGFALGAVVAAEFLHGKTGVFTMNDLLNI